jgi:hypothetical protein
MYNSQSYKTIAPWLAHYADTVPDLLPLRWTSEVFPQLTPYVFIHINTLKTFTSPWTPSLNVIPFCTKPRYSDTQYHQNPIKIPRNNNKSALHILQNEQDCN